MVFRHTGDAGRLEKMVQRHRAIQSRAQLRDNLRRQKRVAAELEKIIVDADLRQI